MYALACAVALLFAAPAHAERSGTPAPITPALYVARDADSTLYLYGTVHVRPSGASWGGAAARQALASAEEVWTEIEISPRADAAAQALAQRLGAAPAGRPLSSWLSAAENARLVALSRRLGIQAGALEAMAPWAAALTLTLIPIQQAGYDPQSGVDRAIDAYGDAHSKSMRAFETAEAQIGFLAGLSPHLQRQMLLEAIEETELGPALLAQLTAAWEAGDIETLDRLVVADTRADYPELYEVLFRRRNAVWMETLMRELDGAGVDFVAVGAGHLLGEDGLVTQLRARGVSVERVAANE